MGFYLTTADERAEKKNRITRASTGTRIPDGWNLVSDTTDGVTNYYNWGIDLSGSLQGAGGVGGLLSVIRNGVTYYPVGDANGNITDYVDASGIVVAHREFDAFGNTIVATGPMVHEFHHWFSSKYLDEDTGFYYYGYRYFSSELGRWPSRDPMGDEVFYLRRQAKKEPSARLSDAELRLLLRVGLSPTAIQVAVDTARTEEDKNREILDRFVLDYSYVGNNAIDGIDLLGLCIFECAQDCIFDAGGGPKWSMCSTFAYNCFVLHQPGACGALGGCVGVGVGSVFACYATCGGACLGNPCYKYDPDNIDWPWE